MGRGEGSAGEINICCKQAASCPPGTGPDYSLPKQSAPSPTKAPTTVNTIPLSLLLTPASRVLVSLSAPSLRVTCTHSLEAEQNRQKGGKSFQWTDPLLGLR